MSVFIIAEAGDNHNGEIDLAYELIDVAANSGADCVKFQTFVTEEVVTKYADMAIYQKINSSKEANSQYDLIKSLELSFADFRKLKEYAEKKGIMFLSTAFDLVSIEFLKSLNLKLWKIPSGEITNLPYLLEIAKTKKDVILSTGMCTMEEIKTAYNFLKHNGAGEITILHCNTEYPTPMIDVNLNAMLSIKREFNTSVGYSDHTLGIHIPIAATALGAKVIEKHFTLSREMEGPDHKASLEPDELSSMVKAIRNVETALGDGNKRVTKSEAKNVIIARKSIVAKKQILHGEVFTVENLGVKRPGNGINPMKWFEIIGKKAIRDFNIDEMIEI